MDDITTILECNQSVVVDSAGDFRSDSQGDTAAKRYTAVGNITLRIKVTACIEENLEVGDKSVSSCL